MNPHHHFLLVALTIGLIFTIVITLTYLLIEYAIAPGTLA